MKEHWTVEPDGDKWRVIQRRIEGGYSALPQRATREEAQADWQRMRDVGLCHECGDVLNDSFVEPYKTQIHERQICFRCLHWTSYVETKGDPTHLVVGGYHYVIEPDRNTTRGYGTLGHGGARFDIRLHDGREVVSRNLWAQGRIPKHFRDRLPDTAVFVTHEHIPVGNLRPGGGGYVGPGSADRPL